MATPAFSLLAAACKPDNVAFPLLFAVGGRLYRTLVVGMVTLAAWTTAHFIVYLLLQVMDSRWKPAILPKSVMILR